jgi:hypothetical protein
LARGRYLEDWKIKFWNTVLWHRVNSCAGDHPRDPVVPNPSLACARPVICQESSQQADPRDQPRHILTENENF